MDDWDHNILVVLWDYRTTCKRLGRQNSFSLVYIQEVIMPLEYIIPSLGIAVITEMTNVGVVEEILSQLVHLE